MSRIVRIFSWRKPTVLLLFTVAHSCWGFLKSGEDQAWAGNLGWIDMGAERETGLRIGEFFLEGYAYSHSSGWILLGDGSPQNGIRYSNTTRDDFGVNRIESGSLRGYAYSPNLGWIAFHENGNPRIDLVTGDFSGFAYALNAGWIALETLSAREIVPGEDSNGNGIPDSWERDRLGGLSDQRSDFDSDGDGKSDFAEYEADTNPLDLQDRFAITGFSRTGLLEGFLQWKSRPSRIYLIESSSDLVEWRSILGPLAGQDEWTSLSVPIDGTEPLFLRVKTVLPTEVGLE